MTSNTPKPSNPGSSGDASPGAGIQAGMDAGARYFVELGWSGAQARAWLGDSMALAQLPIGSVAREAARLSPSMGNESQGSGAFQFQVYRELEILERQARAALLHEITARLARRAATPGAAGLMLLLPSSAHSREALVERLQREGRRARSERLHAAIRSLGVEPSMVACDGDAPGSVAAALAMAARWLWPGDAADLAEAEIELAFGRVSAARAGVEALLAGLQPSDPGGTPSQGVEPESDEEAALRERCLRILTLVHFVQGDAEAALSLTHALPLVLDRSASMGALRAAADFCMGDRGPERRPAVRDEFTAPIDTEERRRIARFLALAHGAVSTPKGDGSKAPGVEQQRVRNPRPVEGLPW